MRALTLELFDLGNQVVRSGFEHSLVVPLGTVTNILKSRAPVLRVADYGARRELAPLSFKDQNCVSYMLKFFLDRVVLVHVNPECAFWRWCNDIYPTHLIWLKRSIPTGTVGIPRPMTGRIGRHTVSQAR